MLVWIEDDEEWGLVRSEYWYKRGHIEDICYDDAPDLPGLSESCENTFCGQPDLEQYRARGFEILEDPIWWYDKRFVHRNA